MEQWQDMISFLQVRHTNIKQLCKIAIAIYQPRKTIYLSTLYPEEWYYFKQEWKKHPFYEQVIFWKQKNPRVVLLIVGITHKEGAEFNSWMQNSILH